MWSLNEKRFDTFEALNAFVQSDAFLQYIDTLKPDKITIESGQEVEERVYGVLENLEAIWYDIDKLSEVDWTTAYSVWRVEADPTKAQQEKLGQLNSIQRQIIDILNKLL